MYELVTEKGNYWDGYKEKRVYRYRWLTSEIYKASLKQASIRDSALARYIQKPKPVIPKSAIGYLQLKEPEKTTIKFGIKGVNYV